MNGRPIVTVGAIHTPRVYVDKGYVATEQRDYPDGTCVLVLWDSRERGEGRPRLFAWNRHKGTTCGSMAREYKSSADISAIVRQWRKVWNTLLSSN